MDGKSDGTAANRLTEQLTRSTGHRRRMYFLFEGVQKFIFLEAECSVDYTTANERGIGNSATSSIKKSQVVSAVIELKDHTLV